MLIVFLVYQQIENHVLNPVIMSRTVQLNPFWVLIAVLVGATLGGQDGRRARHLRRARSIGIPVGGAIQVIVRELRRGPDAGRGASGRAGGLGRAAGSRSTSERPGRHMAVAPKTNDQARSGTRAGRRAGRRRGRRGNLP